MSIILILMFVNYLAFSIHLITWGGPCLRRILSIEQVLEPHDLFLIEFTTTWVMQEFFR
jgi:hypothetical protein